MKLCLRSLQSNHGNKIQIKAPSVPHRFTSFWYNVIKPILYRFGLSPVLSRHLKNACTEFWMFSEPRSHCHNWQNRLSSCSSFPTNNRKNTPRRCNQSPPSDPEGSSCGRRSVRWATNGESEAKVWTAEVSKDLSFKTCSHQGDAAVNDSEGFLGLQCEIHTLKKPKTPKKGGLLCILVSSKKLVPKHIFPDIPPGFTFFGLKKTPVLCRFIAHQATITTLHRNTSLSLFSSTATPLTASRGGIQPQL